MDKPNYSPSITFNAIKYYIMWCPPISCFIAPLTSSIYRYIYRKYPQVLAIGVINYLSYQTRAPPCMFHSISSKIYIFPLYVHYMSIIYVHCICPLYMSIIYVHYMSIIMLPWNHCNPHFHSITAITGMNQQEPTTTFTHTASPRLPRWLRRGLPWAATLHGGRRARGKQPWHQQTCWYCLRTMIE